MRGNRSVLSHWDAKYLNRDDDEFVAVVSQTMH